MMRSPSLLGLGLLLAVSACAQQSGQLRARELFYTPLPDTKTKAVEPKQNEPKPVTKNEAKAVGRPQSSAAGNIQANRSEPSKLTGGGKMQNASVGTPAGDPVGPPLALKYRLLKRNAENGYDEVDTDTSFRSGDKIKVSVESNDAAHLYIVQQGSSKTWNLLFPNEESEHGSNRVERNREYEIPGGGRFTFDEQAGNERLYIILSRRPESDLENLIYTLSQGSNTAKPASAGTSSEKQKMMIAQNTINDALMNRLRERDKVLARDLVFEKVNDDKPATTPAGTRKEKALYVATPDRTAAARIVVDLNLKHQ